MDKKGFVQKVRSGGSVAIVTIPQKILSYLGLKEGDFVRVTLEKSKGGD
jgi:bifunctional DNA-binding transcriptional regulator/antitoxin component of YhaV-PrlF toxin-antitoxin module